MTEETKQMGIYEVKFKTTIDEETGDCAHLKISYNQELLNMLKQVVCLGEPLTDFKLKIGNDIDGSPAMQPLQRYKVKRVIFGSIYGDNKDLVFLKDLIDTGTTTIKLLDVHRVEEIVLGYKQVIGEIGKVMTKYADLDTTISYTINVKNTKDKK